MYSCFNLLSFSVFVSVLIIIQSFASTYFCSSFWMCVSAASCKWGNCHSFFFSFLGSTFCLLGWQGQRQPFDTLHTKLPEGMLEWMMVLFLAHISFPFFFLVCFGIIMKMEKKLLYKLFLDRLFGCSGIHKLVLVNCPCHHVGWYLTFQFSFVNWVSHSCMRVSRESASVYYCSKHHAQFNFKFLFPLILPFAHSLPVSVSLSLSCV